MGVPVLPVQLGGPMLHVGSGRTEMVKPVIQVNLEMLARNSYLHLLSLPLLEPSSAVQPVFRVLRTFVR